MSKKNYKWYSEEFKNPSAKIPFNIYVKIIEKEYRAIEGKRSHSGGSKRSYTITVGNRKLVFVIHEPHKKDKNGYVGKLDHHNVLRILTLLGLIEDIRDNKEGKG